MGTREDYRGAAAALTLTNDLLAASTSFGVTGDTSGWPSGASGRPFGAVIDRGTAKEEKVLCTSLAAATVAITSRGYDGTSAKDHDAGAAFEHYGPSASKMDDLDGHVYDTTRDDHGQYLLINGSRALTGVTALAGTPLSIGGLSNLSGSALTFARSDHVHAIEAGGISDSAMFAPRIVNAAAIADSSLTIGKWAGGAIGTADLGAAVVTKAKMAASSIGNMQPDTTFWCYGGIAGTTAVTSGLLTVTHGAAFAPTIVLVQATSPNGGGGVYWASSVVDQVGATTFRLRALDGAGNPLSNTVLAGVFLALP